MTATGLLIDVTCLTGSNGIAADAQSQLNRMHAAGVKIGLISQQAQALAEQAYAAASNGLDLPEWSVLGLPDEGAEKWLWPKAGQLLRACSQNEIDIFSSWIITAQHDGFKAAAQAGLLGGIYIGDDMPETTLGLQVLNQADSIADAPRVMIPPQGGCWHDK